MTLKHTVRIIWAATILIALGTLLARPDWFTAEHVATVLSRYPHWIWAAYLLISCLRGFTLLPSTPLVLAGTILFPEHPNAVLISSVFCIVLSSALIYLLSPVWQMDQHFKPQKLALIREKLNHPTGSFFVLFWSFFPAVPTDAICYVAGTLRVRILPFLAAVAAGELIICSVYVYLGGSLFSSIKGMF